MELLSDKNPIKCYAWKVTKYEDIPEWAANYAHWESDTKQCIFMDADKGFQCAEPGDYLVKTLENFLYSVCAEEFLERYEICED